MRFLLRLVVVIAVLAVIGLGSLIVIPTERIAALATDRIAQATGREVVITGSVRPTLWPHLGVRAEGLRIGNPDWVEAGPLLTAQVLHVGVNWSALLSGDIRLEQAQIDAPAIVLVRAADGRTSWDFGIAGAAPGDGGSSLAILGFDRAEITGASLRYLDMASGQDLTITDLDAVMTLPEAGGRATANLSGAVNGTRLDLTADIDGLAGFLDGEVHALSLTLDWSGGQIEFDGRASLAPAIDGQLALSANDPGPLLAIMGAAMPDLPQGFGRDRVAVAGDVTLTNEGSLHLRGGTITLDETTLAAALDLTQGPDRPMLRGTLSGGALDLSALTQGSDSAPTGSGWSRDTIDVSGLFGADADLALTFASLDLGNALVSDVDARLTLDRGRLVLDMRRVRAYGGVIAGQFVVNGRGGLSVGGTLSASQVQLSPLLSALADWDRLEGTGNANLQFLGVGNTMASIMDGLTGQGDLSLGAGAILGFDLAGMIRNFDAGFQGAGARTVYDSITGSFTIADGVARNDDLRLEAPWGEVTGAGSTDLGAQTVDYRVIPAATVADTGIRVPILITGPWANLRFRPDLEYLAEQELAEQAAALEAEARERLDAEAARLEQTARDRVNELLGTQIESGNTREEIEDALEQRLRDEAADQLRRLLGRN
jgi:AsmA protein